MSPYQGGARASSHRGTHDIFVFATFRRRRESESSITKQVPEAAERLKRDEVRNSVDERREGMCRGRLERERGAGHPKNAPSGMDG